MGLNPEWVERLKGQYLAGSSHFFILHGNVDDVVACAVERGWSLETLSDYLARGLLGGYDLVFHYDLGRGLRLNSGGDPQRLTRMNAALHRLAGQPLELPRDTGPVLRTLDRLVTRLLVRPAGEAPLKTAFVFDYAELICPPGDYHNETLATFLNWARSPIIKRVNMVFILLAGGLAQLHPALVQSPHTTEIHVPLPDQAARRTFIAQNYPDLAGESERLAELSSGLTLTNLDNLLRLAARKGPDRPAGLEASAAGRQLMDQAPGPEIVKDPGLRTDLLAQIKKQLIEAQCPGLLDFIEPRLALDLVAGHAAARRRLADDARLIKEGRLQAVPMGYLICGPVGVGKTFLALCYAGTVGIPCVTLRNFRSKYVGETEANLERILVVLRELGPVAVIIDEADAAVGDRGASGDSGTSARVFAQLASQMGDTRYRGRIIWFLLTCRPDFLPVDLKRQGRCEEHIPLFYPETPDDVREMFLAMARKLKMDLRAEEVPDVSEPLSGADIEAVLTRARRESLLQDRKVDQGLLTSVLTNFRSPRGPEHELQWLAAIIECSDLAYLPPGVRRVMETKDGYEALHRRFRELSARLND
ncbi:MAG: AAA family ATPase [Thermodesulfobacteriota bacterium]